MTAAILLKIDGHDVKVFEQAPELGEVGAGIQVSANAVKVLWKIGLANVIDRQGVKPTSYKFRLYNSGELLQEFPLASTHEEKMRRPILPDAQSGFAQSPYRQSLRDRPQYG